MKLSTVSKSVFAPLCVALSVSLALGGCSGKSMDEHLDSARSYAQQQDTEAAIIEYKNAIRLDPQAAQPRFELGRLYLAANQFEAAEKELNRALELGHSPSEVVPFLSQAYQQTGAENALVNMDYSLEGMDSNQQAQVAYYKLQAFAQLEKEQQARELIDAIGELDTDSVYKPLGLAFSAILDEDFEQALVQTEAAAKIAPDNQDVLLQQAKLYALTKQADKAIDVYQRYVAAYPEDVTKQFALISLLVENQQMEEAAPYLAKLLKKHPNNGLLNQYQGLVETSRGDYDKALKHLEKAIQSGQTGPAARLIAGFAAYQLKDFAAASQHLSMIASNLPDNHAGLRMLADSLLQLGDNEEATDVLSRMDGQGDKDAALFSKAGFQLLQEGNTVEAQKMIERSSELSTEAEDLARLGILQLSMNDVEGMVNLESAAAQAPDSVATQKTLISAYIRTGQLDKAREVAGQWMQNAPDDVAPYLYLSEAEVAEGNTDKALALLDKAEALDSDNRMVKLAQAKAYIVAGDYADADPLLTRLLANNEADTQALSLLYASTKQQDKPVTAIEQRARKALENHPDNASLRIGLARLQMAEQDFATALDTLGPFKADKSAPMAFWPLEGQALIRTGAMNKAEQHYKKWASLYPADKAAVLGKLMLDDANNQRESALQTIERFLDKRPDAQIEVLKAYFLALEKQIEPAREVLTSLPEKVQAVPFVRGINARLLLLEGKAKEALADAKAAYGEDANPKNAMLVIASYQNSGQKQAGFDFLADHYAKHPNDLNAAVLYAERLITKDRAKAKEVYHTIMEQLPDNFVVLNNLAYLHLEDGQLDNAEPLARRAVELRPKSANAVDTLAQILIARDRVNEAAGLYDQVNVETIRDDEVYLNYVEILINTNQHQLAQRRLNAREFAQASAQQRANQLRQLL